MMITFFFILNERTKKNKIVNYNIMLFVFEFNVYKKNQQVLRPCRTASSLKRLRLGRDVLKKYQTDFYSPRIVLRQKQTIKQAKIHHIIKLPDDIVFSRGDFFLPTLVLYHEYIQTQTFLSMHVVGHVFIIDKLFGVNNCTSLIFNDIVNFYKSIVFLCRCEHGLFDKSACDILKTTILEWLVTFRNQKQTCISDLGAVIMGENVDSTSVYSTFLSGADRGRLCFDFKMPLISPDFLSRGREHDPIYNLFPYSIYVSKEDWLGATRYFFSKELSLRDCCFPYRNKIDIYINDKTAGSADSYIFAKFDKIYFLPSKYSIVPHDHFFTIPNIYVLYNNYGDLVVSSTEPEIYIVDDCSCFRMVVDETKTGNFLDDAPLNKFTTGKCFVLAPSVTKSDDHTVKINNDSFTDRFNLYKNGVRVFSSFASKPHFIEYEPLDYSEKALAPFKKTCGASVKKMLPDMV